MYYKAIRPVSSTSVHKWNILNMKLAIFVHCLTDEIFSHRKIGHESPLLVGLIEWWVTAHKFKGEGQIRVVSGCDHGCDSGTGMGWDELTTETSFCAEWHSKSSILTDSHAGWVQISWEGLNDIIIIISYVTGLLIVSLLLHTKSFIIDGNWFCAPTSTILIHVHSSSYPKQYACTMVCVWLHYAFRHYQAYLIITVCYYSIGWMPQIPGCAQALIGWH